LPTGDEMMTEQGELMRIEVTSVMVDDQEKALQFYTNILGFMKKRDDPIGGARWLTVVSPDGPQMTELLLDPNFNPMLNGAAQAFQRALVEANIPYTTFAVDDVRAEYERLKALGVNFTLGPTEAGPVTIAVFDDTCGNLIQMHQVIETE
jgi:catechol 2,3-dioxygenase-like lactoylglutathione lyase family enzyme